ncbi:MAG: metal-dependent hydrolase [Vicinamibacterales bacterium]|nr:metal-dependent hydrolase [Vicinamibacterales bacterium]
MDNICHTLVGAALGEAGLKHRTRFGMVTLAIAANLPDIDAGVILTPFSHVAFRRGWTHGVAAQFLLPVLLTVAMLLWDRRHPRAAGEPPAAKAGWLLFLSYLGVLSHVGLDYLNNYGVRLLMPWSGQWFYGDTLFIVDPWLYLTLGGGWWLARRLHRASPARAGLGLAAVYIAAMLMLAGSSRTSVLAQWRALTGREPKALMVGPVFADPFHKQVIVDRGDNSYATGRFSWLPGTLTMTGVVPTLSPDDPDVVAARADPGVAGILVWSRFPHFERQDGENGPEIVVTDLRFGRFVAAAAVGVTGR